MSDLPLLSLVGEGALGDQGLDPTPDETMAPGNAVTRVDHPTLETEEVVNDPTTLHAILEVSEVPLFAGFPPTLQSAICAGVWDQSGAATPKVGRSKRLLTLVSNAVIKELRFRNAGSKRQKQAKVKMERLQKRLDRDLEELKVLRAEHGPLA